MILDGMPDAGRRCKIIMEDGMPSCFEDLKYRIGMGIADFLWEVGEKLENVINSMKIDEEPLAAIPLKLVEKERKTMIPSEGVFPRCSIQNLEVTADRIKIHRVLDGFDEDALRCARERIVEACTFILGNAGNDIEKNIAGELARMLWKGAVIITDADLVLDTYMAGCFYTIEGLPYIGLDISVLRKSDDAALVDTLVHEAYHAWRHFTSDTEYSIIDEKRAWNIGLAVSNKYRHMYGIPVKRENEYTENELLNNAYYLERANVNIQIGPGEPISENRRYGIAGMIENDMDTVREMIDI
jgi:hypothetical protein